MTALLSGHGQDRDALDTARRTVPYRKLILFSTKPDAADIAKLRDNEALAGVQVEVERVNDNDFTKTLDAATRILDVHAKTGITVHVAGGTNLLTSALLLAAFQRGAAAFFCTPRGVTRLPVIREAQFVERFTPNDRSVLTALSEDEPISIAKLVTEKLPLQTARAALLRLRGLGVVHADHREASLTPTGRYYRRHILAQEARE